MEITEKLNLFYRSAIDVANKQSSADMRDFTASLEKLQDEFKKNKSEELESRYRVEEEKLKRDANRRISEAVTEQKRQLNLHQQEKKKVLFDLVESLLKKYQETEEYETYLVSKIRMAKQFARQEEIIIYLDPVDGDRKERLEQETGCTLTVSERTFGGGIRAVVRSKNVLIDESFQTKLNQERDAYTF